MTEAKFMRSFISANSSVIPDTLIDLLLKSAHVAVNSHPQKRIISSIHIFVFWL
jgi:hypothetical protein